MNITDQLRQELQQLQHCRAALQSSNIADVEVLVNAIIISRDILNTIKLADEKPYNVEVVTFINAIDRVINNLLTVATDMENIYTPSKNFLADVTEAFSRFVDQYASRPVLKAMRRVSEYVPYIGSIIDCCEDAPKYWGSASRNGKIAIALGVTLLLTSVVLTIAFYVSPALAAVPLMGLAIAGIAAVASACYRLALVNPRNAEIKRAKIKGVLIAVENQKKMVAKMLVAPENAVGNTKITSKHKTKLD